MTNDRTNGQAHGAAGARPTTTGRRQVLRAMALAPAALALSHPGAAGADPLWSQARPGSVVTRDGVRVAYHEYGPAATEAPTVYFSGGWPVDSRGYEPLAQMLAQRYHVVRYEHRGSGATDHPAEQSMYSIERLADEFADVVEATSAGRPVHGFGQAWPPFIYSEFSRRNPGRLATLTSIGAPSLDLAGHALAEARFSGDPMRQLQLLGQALGLSYIGLLQIPGLAEAVARSGITVGVFNAAINALAGDWNATIDPRDLEAGVKKYRESMIPRVLQPTYDRLEVPVVQVVQPTLEPIEHPVLTDGLERRVPRLIRHEISATHLSFVLHARTLAGWTDEVISGYESGALR